MSESESLSGESNENIPWIKWMLKWRENAWLIEVDRSFIEDSFNLYGLRTLPKFGTALRTILGELPAGSELYECPYYVEAKRLYFHIHARFIVTNAGTARMQTNIESHLYGECPRLYCNSHYLLPIGLGSGEGSPAETTKLFCPRCEELYLPTLSTPASAKPVDESSVDSTDSSDERGFMQAHPSKIDGVAFGPTFAHLTLLSRPPVAPSAAEAKTYTPRIFGFKVHNQRGRLRDSLGDASGVYAQCVPRSLLVVGGGTAATIGTTARGAAGGSVANGAGSASASLSAGRSPAASTVTESSSASTFIAAVGRPQADGRLAPTPSLADSSSSSSFWFGEFGSLAGMAETAVSYVRGIEQGGRVLSDADTRLMDALRMALEPICTAAAAAASASASRELGITALNDVVGMKASATLSTSMSPSMLCGSGSSNASGSNLSVTALSSTDMGKPAGINGFAPSSSSSSAAPAAGVGSAVRDSFPVPRIISSDRLLRGESQRVSNGGSSVPSSSSSTSSTSSLPRPQIGAPQRSPPYVWMVDGVPGGIPVYSGDEFISPAADDDGVPGFGVGRSARSNSSSRASTASTVTSSTVSTAETTSTTVCGDSRVNVVKQQQRITSEKSTQSHTNATKRPPPPPTLICSMPPFRQGRPLTTMYPEGMKPANDDFTDTDDDAPPGASSSAGAAAAAAVGKARVTGKRKR